jgi:hypothetical protein
MVTNANASRELIANVSCRLPSERLLQEQIVQAQTACLLSERVRESCWQPRSGNLHGSRNCKSKLYPSENHTIILVILPPRCTVHQNNYCKIDQFKVWIYNLRYARNATFFRHFLAHFPYILAHELRNLAKKSDGKRKKSFPRCYAILCERTDSLRALDSVAGYIENGHFHPINDSLPRAFGVFTTFSDDTPDVKRFAQVRSYRCSHLRAIAHVGGPNLLTSEGNYQQGPVFQGQSIESPIGA